MTRSPHDPGFLLLEALTALAVLAIASLFLARALADALHAASLAANRSSEASLRQLAADPTSLSAADGQWRRVESAHPAPPVGRSNPPCWRRLTPLSRDFVWIEVRCGVGRNDLLAAPGAPGLLVPR